MKTTNFFTQVRGFGQPLEFSPMPVERWDELHTSTRQNCEFVFASNLRQLRLEYAKASGWFIAPVGDNFMCRWHDSEGEFGPHFANDQNLDFASQEVLAEMLK